MAWHTTQGAFTAGDSVPTAAAEGLVLRDDDLPYRPFKLDWSADSRTDVTYGDIINDLTIWLPAEVSGMYLYVQPEAYVTSGTGYYRIQDVTSSEDGSDSEAITNTGSYARVGDDGASKVLIAGTMRTVHTFDIQGKCSGGGTIYLQNSGLTAWFQAT